MGKLLKIIGIALVILLVGIFLWGNLIEPRIIDETRYEVSIPDLPDEWNGARIAFITDIQIGIWFGNPDTARRAVLRIIKEKPAAVLLGGDFIYHPTEADEPPAEALLEYESEEKTAAVSEITRVVQILRPFIDMGIPVYAVLGNHDFAMETKSALKVDWVAEQLATSLQEAGITVLENEVVEIQRQGRSTETDTRPLYLVGIGPHYPGKDRIENAFSNLPEGAPRIVLMHNPESFQDIPAGQAPLAMAGHTHGGQIRLPYMPAWTWLSIVAQGEVHADGWIEDFGNEGNRLYVNRGIGFSTIPVRINCTPELTYFTLIGG
ncbi:MAG: metallophosphoesterase [Desulfococcaceae bacterium]